MIDLVRPESDDDLRAFRAVASDALLFDVPAGVEWPDGADRDHLVVAKNDGVVVGGWVAWPMGQFFGSRSVPCAGIRAVAVAPSHRGQGLADRMMRRALADARQGGAPLAALYPATQGLYRKTGWEAAGHRVLYRVALHDVPPATRDVVVREGGRADLPLLRALHERRARASSGHLDRIAYAWERMIEPPIGGRRRVYVFEERGAAAGYAITSTRKDANAGKGELWIWDHVTATPSCARALRSFAADHRSMIKDVLFYGAPAEPWWMPLEESRMAVEDWKRWMLRIVDVPAALEARGYAPGQRATLHLQIDDDVLAHNAGRFVLDVEDGRARVTPGGEGSLRAHVRGLASLYASYLSPHELRTTGLLDGDDASLATAQAIFAGPQPWMPEMF